MCCALFVVILVVLLFCVGFDWFVSVINDLVCGGF